MIDNFASIPDLCHFTGDNFYKFFLMIRKKDVGEHPLIISKSQENIIKIWLVNSEEYLNKKINEMKYLLKVIPNTRLYMCTDAKSNLKTIMTIRNNLNKVIDSALFGSKENLTPYISRMLSSSTSAVESSEHDFKKYMIDVDTKDENVLKSVLDNLYSITDLSPIVLNSKNGYHIVIKRAFNPSMFKQVDNVTLKKDAAVLIAMS